MIYQTQRVHEQIGTMSFTLDCLVDFEASVDQLFAELAKQPNFDPTADPQHFEALCPYFGVLWPPARILGHYLAKLGQLVFHGKRVLELGCGLALPSLVLANLGADVTASDWHVSVPDFLRRNTALNRLPALKYHQADWFSDAQALANLGLFDVIVGSDILYDRAHPHGLKTVIERHLAPHGVVVIADANRSYAADFAKLMAQSGFSCRILDQVVTGNLPRQSTSEILVKIYEFQTI